MEVAIASKLATLLMKSWRRFWWKSCAAFDKNLAPLLDQKLTTFLDQKLTTFCAARQCVYQKKFFFGICLAINYAGPRLYFDQVLFSSGPDSVFPALAKTFKKIRVLEGGVAPSARARLEPGLKIHERRGDPPEEKNWKYRVFIKLSDVYFFTLSIRLAILRRSVEESASEESSIKSYDHLKFGPHRFFVSLFCKKCPFFQNRLAPTLKKSEALTRWKSIRYFFGSLVSPAVVVRWARIARI